MKGTVRRVMGEPKETKSGKTYYRAFVEDEGGSENWLSLFQQYNVGDVIEYEPGNLPGWPHKVHLVDKKTVGDYSPTAPIAKDSSGQFGRVEYTNLLKAVVAIAELAGLTDHQAIAALNNTLLISLQRQGVKIDISSFTGTPF